MKILAIVLVALSLYGCDQITKPDTRTWESVSCSGFSGWVACKREASAACSKGYDIANQEENQVTQKRFMQYSCK